MVDILAIGAHPDDLEFGCGGILAKMAHQGKSIVMADMTLGEKGSQGTPEIRRKEGEAAAALIGAKRVFLDFEDCEVLDHYAARLKLVALIREHRPRLVLTSLWKGEQSHPDHMATGIMARYACRYARFKKILPDFPVHVVEGILHYPFPTAEHFDFLIDISPYVEVWTQMMRCHASQMETFPYDDWNLRRASALGTLIGTPYAQALVKGNPIIIDDVMTIAKGAREI